MFFGHRRHVLRDFSVRQTIVCRPSKDHSTGGEQSFDGRQMNSKRQCLSNAKVQHLKAKCKSLMKKMLMLIQIKKGVSREMDTPFLYVLKQCFTRQLRQSSRRCTTRHRRRRCRLCRGQGPAWCWRHCGTWAAAWWSA